MHRTIRYLSRRFAHIHPGEGRKVLLTFAYFFLVITAYYVIKPVSRSLVLDDLRHRMVPYADLICAILMGPIVTLFARLADRVQKPRLVTLSFWAVTGMMVLFWWLLSFRQPWVAGAFYIWVAIFSVLVVTLFWLVANDLYRPREAKRLFGFIGSGGVLGGITGSSIAALGAQLIGTQRLLLLSAGLLVASWLIVQQLWRLEGDRTGEAHPGAAPSAKAEGFLSDPRGYFKLISQSRYLMLLVVIVGVNKIVATFVSYQLNPLIEQAFPTVDAKTTFNGIFLGAINVMAFVVQFFFTSVVLRRWGLLTAMLALPIGLLGGSAALLFLPTFWLAAGTEWYDRSLSYSLDSTSKEMLYLPIDRSIRYKVKPFIDMVVFRFGKGIAAIAGIILLDLLHVPTRWLACLTVPLLVFWILAALQMRREYTATLRTVLQARSHARRAKAAVSGAPAGPPLPGLGLLTGGRPADRKLSLAEALVAGPAESVHGRELLAKLRRYEESASSAPGMGPAYSTHRLKQTIQDRGSEVPVRRLAVRLMARQRTQESLDYLWALVMLEEESALREEVLRELVKLRLTRRGLQYPVEQMRRQVEREIAHYVRITRVATVYRRHHPGPPDEQDPVLGMLRVLLEESVEQVFRLLMLLYRPTDIQLVYEQLRTSDAYLRADAIELLDNLVDPAMRAVIFPILDEDRFMAVLDDDALDMPAEPTVEYRVFQEAIWDHNCWLSVTTLCAIGRLGLTAMREELDRASQQAVPLIATAAKVAIAIAAVR